jgi:hypothetical protein
MAEISLKTLSRDLLYGSRGGNGQGVKTPEGAIPVPAQGLR